MKWPSYSPFNRGNVDINFPPQPCTAPRMCVENKCSVLQFALLYGLKEVTRALSCSLSWSTSSCPPSQCVGSCSKGILLGLRLDMCSFNSHASVIFFRFFQPPIYFVLILADSIGADCVEKVLSPGCKRSCHRVSFHQLFSVNVFDQQTSRNETLGQVCSTSWEQYVRLCYTNVLLNKTLQLLTVLTELAQ